MEKRIRTKSEVGDSMPDYYCHNCTQRFPSEVTDKYRTYEFRRCVHCGSAKTTLAE